MVEGDPFLSYLTWLNTEGHWEREGGRERRREGGGRREEGWEGGIGKKKEYIETEKLRERRQT